MKVPAQAWKGMFPVLAYDDLVELERITAPALLVGAMRDGLLDRDAGAARRAHRRGGLPSTAVWPHAALEDARRFATDVPAFVERRASPPRQ